VKLSFIKLYLSFYLGIILTGLHAQQTIISTSNDAAGIQGTVSYSVGQIVFHTKTGTSGNVSEGIQQPYEILFMTGIDEEMEINLECVLYPNPASSFVKLKIEKQTTRNLHFDLYNVNSVLLKSMKIEKEETTIPMEELVPATYFLTVFENNTILKTFRIIKK
jgi:hypothetical protein